MSPASPRYPDLRIRLRTENPYALVSAIRLALRRAGTGRDEIERFTEEAVSIDDPCRLRQLCGRWASIE